MDGLFANDDSAGMDGKVVGKAFYVLTVLEDVLGKVMVFFCSQGFIDDGVDICFW